MPDTPRRRLVAAQFREVPSHIAIETLADPGYIIRCMILDAMKQFVEDNEGCEPTVIHLTHGMEVLLNQHIRLERIDGGRPLRECGRLLGFQEVLFDRSSFKLE